MAATTFDTGRFLGQYSAKKLPPLSQPKSDRGALGKHNIFDCLNNQELLSVPRSTVFLSDIPNFEKGVTALSQSNNIDNTKFNNSKISLPGISTVINSTNLYSRDNFTTNSVSNPSRSFSINSTTTSASIADVTDTTPPQHSAALGALFQVVDNEYKKNCDEMYQQCIVDVMKERQKFENTFKTLQMTRIDNVSSTSILEYIDEQKLINLMKSSDYITLKFSQLLEIKQKSLYHTTTKISKCSTPTIKSTDNLFSVNLPSPLTAVSSRGTQITPVKYYSTPNLVSSASNRNLFPSTKPDPHLHYERAHFQRGPESNSNIQVASSLRFLQPQVKRHYVPVVKLRERQSNIDVHYGPRMVDGYEISGQNSNLKSEEQTSSVAMTPILTDDRVTTFKDIMIVNPKVCDPSKRPLAYTQPLESYFDSDEEEETAQIISSGSSSSSGNLLEGVNNVSREGKPYRIVKHNGGNRRRKKKAPKFTRDEHGNLKTCVHCSDADTAEWRVGPYGERTLCNACGLFHRKLTDKFGVKYSNILMRYRKRINPFNRRVPAFIEVPANFVKKLLADPTIDQNFFNIK
ncbi:hypothetical protein KAFR_0B05930 [Kazachstania africana CBS 2517]|uniref:GATA-type domain-containing protein n=1 Tax=Kazachstania africana (strain ATCC 22294 / BCRC 22015 / CBS 2517 / CECT 1963 / NBRC 1671 / NRRL Y-8276) TaxID=1071382 RepID=H2AR89_KAZAF|nr:hypothetical protein KAFR_0B05930 [Kazachstania africana CBS 2517]CCF56889.1 hypothetical protein KAFR_0B05930 [Kazachstania africana CBS 2517]